jgi:hypothetical protein
VRTRGLMVESDSAMRAGRRDLECGLQKSPALGTGSPEGLTHAQGNDVTRECSRVPASLLSDVRDAITHGVRRDTVLSDFVRHDDCLSVVE